MLRWPSMRSLAERRPVTVASIGELLRRMGGVAPWLASARGAGRALAFAVALLLGALALASCSMPGASSGRPVATQTPTPPPSAGVVYQDSLMDRPTGWPTSHGCAFAADGYHVTNGALCPAPLAHPIGDGVIRVTAQAVTTNASTSYGIVFRLVDLKNYYGFEITPNGKWTFYKEVNGVFHSLVDYTFVGAIQMGSTARNILEVDAHGSHFVFLDDGVTVGQGDDTTFAVGACGVDGATGAEIVYSNFRVATA